MQVGEVRVALADLVASERQLEEDVVDGVGFAAVRVGGGGVRDADIECGRHEC